MGIFGKGPETKPADAPPRPAQVASPAPTQSPSKSSPCLIGSKTIVKGELGGDEDVVIEGVVEGQLRIGKDVYVAPGGSVKANVVAHSVVVAGELIGDVQASIKVEIQATGRLTGNLRAPKIVIAEGAVFKGNSDMSGRKDERKDQTAVS